MSYELVPGLAYICWDNSMTTSTSIAEHLAVVDGVQAVGVGVFRGGTDAREGVQIAAQIASAVTASTGYPVEGLTEARIYVENHYHYIGLDACRPTVTGVALAIGHGGTELAWVGRPHVWGITSAGAVLHLTIPACSPTITCDLARCHEADQRAGWPHRRVLRPDLARLVLIGTDLDFDETASDTSWSESLARVAGRAISPECALATLRHRLGEHAHDLTLAAIDLCPTL